MKVLLKRLKRGMAFVVAVLTIVGFTPFMDECLLNVKAKERNIPSVTAFATKEELMSVFDLDGTNDIIGKIKLGTNQRRSPHEWYIAGRDEGVEGDNVVLFGAGEFFFGVQFNRAEGDYSYEANTGYGDMSGSVLVDANHYGISIIRMMLDRAVSSYFTVDEQNLLNTTSVTTKDIKSDVNYITTDYLYLPDVNNTLAESTKVYVGTDNNVKIAMESGWPTADNTADFWLRSSVDNSSDMVHIASPGETIGSKTVNSTNVGTRAVGNLNLSSVMFASAAIASESGVVSDTIPSGIFMTLRIDGNSTVKGKVQYNVETGEINIIIDDETGTATPIAVIIQGNDGTKDWYYSKLIEETQKISVDDIKSALALSDISLLDCKIWLETTKNNVAYAKMAEKVSDGSLAPETPEVLVKYDILTGKDSTWEGGADGLSIKGDGDYDKFLGVKVDGVLLSEENYTVKEGSTIVTLKESYLSQLSKGAHEIEILWDDGSAKTTFEIQEIKSPKTNDGDMRVMIGMVLMMGFIVVKDLKGKREKTRI